MSFVRRLSRAWRILTWRHWAWATGLALAVSFSMPLQGLDRNSYWMAQQALLHPPWFILFSYVFIAAIVWVESGEGPEALSTSRYVAATALAGIACIVVAALLAEFIPRAPFNIIEGVIVPLPPRVDPAWGARLHAAILGFDVAFHGCLATLIYVHLRKSRRAARALAQAELDRSEASRSLMAWELEAARSEIDPEAMISRLEGIERHYDLNPAEADARLDELIAFLRGAIPRLRSVQVALLAA
jgi:hypothetical protein